MKKYHLALGTLQAFTALGAIPAGIAYLLDTTGKEMGVTTELLANSPLTSFLLPGLFLLLVNGFGNAVGAWLSFRRKPAAGITGLVLGILLALWILIQVAWIGLSSFLQPLFLGVGICNALLGWNIRRTGAM